MTLPGKKDLQTDTVFKYRPTDPQPQKSQPGRPGKAQPAGQNHQPPPRETPNTQGNATPPGSQTKAGTPRPKAKAKEDQDPEPQDTQEGPGRTPPGQPRPGNDNHKGAGPEATLETKEHERATKRRQTAETGPGGKGTPRAPGTPRKTAAGTPGQEHGQTPKQTEQHPQRTGNPEDAMQDKTGDKTGGTTEREPHTPKEPAPDKTETTEGGMKTATGKGRRKRDNRQTRYGKHPRPATPQRTKTAQERTKKTANHLRPPAGDSGPPGRPPEAPPPAGARTPDCTKQPKHQNKNPTHTLENYCAHLNELMISLFTTIWKRRTDAFDLKDFYIRIRENPDGYPFLGR